MHNTPLPLILSEPSSEFGLHLLDILKPFVSVCADICSKFEVQILQHIVRDGLGNNHLREPKTLHLPIWQLNLHGIVWKEWLIASRRRCISHQFAVRDVSLTQ